MGLAYFSSFGCKGPTYSEKIASYNIISHNIIAMIGSVVVKCKKKLHGNNNNGRVVVPWHFEFYILKCKNFLIDFLDELGNLKQKNFTTTDPNIAIRLWLIIL